MAKRKINKIVFFSVFLLVVLFANLISGVNFAIADDLNAVTVSVTVINPEGPDAIVTAVPEKRIPNIPPDHTLNRATTLKFWLFPHDANRNNENNAIITSSLITNDLGISNFFTLTGLPNGYYDVKAKGLSHLSRVLTNIYIGPFVQIDFTATGTNPLLCGDINLTNGDDKVNSLDMSVLVNEWGSILDTRSDLNKDFKVNSLDMSNLLANFNVTGE